MNILNNFKYKNTNVILLTTQYAGSGIDISIATDVIILHSMDADKQQAIGRAQRVGRSTPLNVHNLCYEHEMNNNNII
jgi:SNF2 family DNA or RNA helicase